MYISLAASISVISLLIRLFLLRLTLRLGSSDSKIHHQKHCRPHLVPLGGEDNCFVQPLVVGVSASNHHVAIVTKAGDVYVIFTIFHFKPQHPLQVHVGQRLCWSAGFGSSWCSR